MTGVRKKLGRDNEPGFYYLSKRNIGKASQRSGAKHSNTQRVMIEGEMVNMYEVAERLGCNPSTVYLRRNFWLEIPGPLTWARLRTTPSKAHEQLAREQAELER